MFGHGGHPLVLAISNCSPPHPSFGTLCDLGGLLLPQEEVVLLQGQVSTFFYPKSSTLITHLSTLKFPKSSTLITHLHFSPKFPKSFNPFTKKFPPKVPLDVFPFLPIYIFNKSSPKRFPPKLPKSYPLITHLHFPPKFPKSFNPFTKKFSPKVPLNVFPQSSP